MQNAELITMLQVKAGMKFVRVIFEGGSARNEQPQEYTYKALLAENLAIGDYVVVEARGTFSVAKVVNPDVGFMQLGIGFEKLRHVICKLDLTGLHALHQQENAILEQFAMAEINRRIEASAASMGLTQLPTFDLASTHGYVPQQAPSKVDIPMPQEPTVDDHTPPFARRKVVREQAAPSLYDEPAGMPSFPTDKP